MKMIKRSKVSTGDSFRQSCTSQVLNLSIIEFETI